MKSASLTFFTEVSTCFSSLLYFLVLRSSYRLSRRSCAEDSRSCTIGKTLLNYQQTCQLQKQ